MFGGVIRKILDLGPGLPIIDQALPSQNTGWINFTLREVIGTVLFNGVAVTRLRLTLLPYLSNSAQMDKCYVGTGASSGNNYDFVGDQIPVTFSGNTSVSLTDHTPFMSDWMDFVFDSTLNMVVSAYFSGTGLSLASAQPVFNTSGLFKVGDSAVTTVTGGGYTLLSSTLIFITKLEVLHGPT